VASAFSLALVFSLSRKDTDPCFEKMFGILAFNSGFSGGMSRLLGLTCRVLYISRFLFSWSTLWSLVSSSLLSVASSSYNYCSSIYSNVIVLTRFLSCLCSSVVLLF
jgi:hypothetical protein